MKLVEFTLKRKEKIQKQAERDGNLREKKSKFFRCYCWYLVVASLEISLKHTQKNNK